VGGTARVTRAASAARWRANARSAVNCTLGRRRNARGTLFAQGLGPRPDRVEVKPAAPEHPCVPGRHDTDADPVPTEGPQAESSHSSRFPRPILPRRSPTRSRARSA
jgi:hypothetical protein